MFPERIIKDVGASAIAYGTLAYWSRACDPKAAAIYSVANDAMRYFSHYCGIQNQIAVTGAAVAAGIYITQALGYNMSIETVEVLAIMNIGVQVIYNSYFKQ